jgi:hypothetical protein
MLAHWISEATRLGRSPDRPEDITPVLRSIQAGYQDLGVPGDLAERIRRAVDQMLVRVGLANRGPWFDDPTDDHPLRAWIREVSLPRVPATPEGRPRSPEARELMEVAKRVEVPPP